MRAWSSNALAAALVIGTMLGVAACNAILGIEETTSIEGIGACPDGGCLPGDGGPVGGDGSVAPGDGGPSDCRVDDPRPGCNTCEPGFDLVAGLCMRVSACASDNGGCPDNALCEDSEDGVTCTCKADFADVNGDGSSCVELCSIANCPAEFSTCSVVNGAAVCACEPSYLFVEEDNECVYDAACSELGCDPVNASCVVEDDERVCQCNAGFEGDGFDCENPDACDPNPCMNGGACKDGLDSFDCTCAAGFAGDTCEENIDDCAAMPCQNGGTCMDGVASYECSCPKGFEGPSCATNHDDCSPNPCLNGGTCNDEVDGFDCECVVGYRGDTCEENIADCVPGLCENGGTCTDLVNGYMCMCATGYSGQHCGTNIDDCSPNPCERGTCTDRVNDFLCTCPNGWDGKTCSHNIDDCSPNPCARGTCTDLVNDFSCSCPPGYDGKTCSNNINDCSPNPCARGTCSDLVNDFMCSCPSGYDGKTCNNNINDCSPNPCARGTCSDLVNDFMCSCPAGWEGKTCDTNHDDCSPNPCQNGGSCTDAVNGFTCACINGYSGTTCTTAPACTPNIAFCESGTRYARACTPSGTLGTRTECWTLAPPDGRLCINGSCTGDCAPGRLSCSGQQPVLCSSAGVYQSNGSACGSGTICRTGACINPYSYFGLHTSAGGTRTLSGSRFYATRVRIGNSAVTLSEIGIFGSANGGSVRMAVYSDRLDTGLGEHLPNQLVASGSDTLTVTANVERITDPVGFVSLSANTDYWIVAVTSTTAATIYAQSASAGTNVIISGYPAGFSFGSAFPTSFPPTSTSNFDVEFSVEYSMFLRVPTP